MKWLMLLFLLAGCSVQPPPQLSPNEGLRPGAVLGVVLDAQMVVVYVEPAGGAAQAGIVPGDRLLSVNDLTLVDQLQQVREVIAATGAGSSLAVGIERQGQRLIVEVTPLPPQPAVPLDGAPAPTTTPMLPPLTLL